MAGAFGRRRSLRERRPRVSATGARQPIASGIALGLCLLAGVTRSAVWLVLPILVVALMGITHPPVEDDEEPLDFGRTLVALLCVAVFLVCFSLTPIRMV